VKDLMYLVPSADRNAAGIKRVLGAHPEIRYVSLSTVDLGGNDTDEKIPVSQFLGSAEEFLTGGVQTDGSSVVLPGIATLNDGKVDLIADPDANWYVDHNYEFIDPVHGKPVGTLRIPSFLKHREQLVDSRAVLKRAMDSVEQRLLALLRSHPALGAELGIPVEQVKKIQLIAATELEFWVRTPGSAVETDKLSVSQVLQESYWKRTKGSVRSALEHSLLLLEAYGLSPEMGHKEVGGVKATVSGQGGFDGIMEQLEIDWKYATALQAADNELLARIMIKEVFRRHGLEVTFMAKAIEGVAGSGEHTHVSIMAVLADGKVKNVFAPRDPQKDFLSPLGWGALMGLLKNYEVVGSFVTASNDAFNRLQPGFEAPVCIVSSVGHDVTMPSRNRTVLAGLVRDISNPLATRFEVRAPNPHSNSFLAISAFYQAMLDGMVWAAGSGRTASELEKDFSKEPGVAHPYLEKDRAYRSEEDVFEHYSAEDRDRLFGKPPATVWETLENLRLCADKAKMLVVDGVFSPEILESYRRASLLRWTMELTDRIIPENARQVRACVRLQGENDLDAQRWQRIEGLSRELMRDNIGKDSIFTKVRRAVAEGDSQLVSTLQCEMARLMKELAGLYVAYRRNIGIA
jgi:glutamine synthetase